ncbi:MAG: 16S rRNA processing protein RimM [Geobacteraceae bacterium]|nr:16S rRNA processing protein RimM [Geobacteraceae bacterium]
MQDGKNLILIGKITGTHGIRGQIRVVPYSGDAGSILSLQSFTVRTQDGRHSSFRIRRAVEHKHKALVSIAGIDDINDVLFLVGCEVYVSRDQLPALPEGEYYWQDLLGLAVVDEQRGVIGELADIFATGAHDVYVVKDGEKEYLVPAVSDVVLEINLSARTMTVRPPEGLLDL